MANAKADTQTIFASDLPGYDMSIASTTPDHKYIDQGY
jgi:hypothetical protein